MLINVIYDTLINHKRVHHTTWQSANEKTQNLLNFVNIAVYLQQLSIPEDKLLPNSDRVGVEEACFHIVEDCFKSDEELGVSIIFSPTLSALSHSEYLVNGGLIRPKATPLKPNEFVDGGF